MLMAVMKVVVFVERIVAFWKGEGLPVQMDSSASKQKINVMEGSTVMTAVMRAPTLVVVISMCMESTRATAWDTAHGRETSASWTVIRNSIIGNISTITDSAKA